MRSIIETRFELLITLTTFDDFFPIIGVTKLIN